MVGGSHRDIIAIWSVCMITGWAFNFTIHAFLFQKSPNSDDLSPLELLFLIPFAGIFFLIGKFLLYLGGKFFDYVGIGFL